MVKSNLPIVDPETPIIDVIRVITRCSLGFAIIELSSGPGVITDGDLRRGFSKYKERLLSMRAKDITNEKPVTITSDSSVKNAYQFMKQKNYHSF